ncbi:hypothetical protein PCANC_00978 [Puccinia coronata f. sp. avenae]|uniref:Uncharacterized protein n=1 Tax=Puccinia coronata f. sp. avenae TaxID=200324 RepID=A0A2N5T7W0_9BASI|nr:hypothetical protein PCANC_04000 [Puccinia coronata f. sp. avenae]PLW57866.1 hypothetical protein PCANC_00978 [Puccinia coronata f. sp. avenae]
METIRASTQDRPLYRKTRLENRSIHVRHHQDQLPSLLCALCINPTYILNKLLKKNGSSLLGASLDRPLLWAFRSTVAHGDAQVASNGRARAFCLGMHPDGREVSII